METVTDYDPDSIQFANFTKLSNTNENSSELNRDNLIAEFKKSQTRIDNKAKREELLKIIEPVTELKSDYLGTSSYYYNASHNTIYEIENISIKLSKVTNSSVDAHLRELNNIKSTVQ